MRLHGIRRLSQEIHWGHMFCPIITPAWAREGDTQHTVDISRFHDVEPQPGLDMVPPYKLSKKVGGHGWLVVGLMGEMGCAQACDWTRCHPHKLPKKVGVVGADSSTALSLAL